MDKKSFLRCTFHLFILLFNIGGITSGSPGGNTVATNIQSSSESTAQIGNHTSTPSAIQSAYPENKFTIDPFSLNVTEVGPGRVELNPVGGAYEEGTIVELTAFAEAGWVFSGWDGDLKGWRNPESVEMNSNKDIAAIFTQIPEPRYSSGILVSPTELSTLPLTGVTWEALKNQADRPAGPPDLSNMDDSSNVNLMAKALVYARTGEEKYRTEVIEGCRAVMGTEEDGGTLSLGRELMAYVIAADLVGLPAAQDSMFSGWLRELLTEELQGRTLQSTHEERPNNWGTHCGASRAALAVYLDDPVELARTALVFKGYLGDRDSYKNFVYGKDLSWQADSLNPVGINPMGAEKEGHSIDGVLPDEQRRSGEFTWPPPKENYAYEGLQGALALAIILYRAGYDVWNWEDRALLRAFQWLNFEANYPPAGDDVWQTHIINHFYNTNFPAVIPTLAGKNMGWTEWFYGPKFGLQVDMTGDGSGNLEINSLGTFQDEFFAIEINAIPDEESFFSGWDGDLNGTANPDTIIMDWDKIVSASFSAYKYTLSVATEGAGEIVITPDDTAYYVGTSVEIKAIPERGWVFSSWGGDFTGSENPATVTLDSDKHITARFNELPDTIFPIFESTEIVPAFELAGSGRNIDTIAFWEAPNPANTMLFVTAKSNSLVEIWRYPFEENQQPPLVHPSFSGGNVNGVVVDQEANLLYVTVSSPVNTVSVFSLPDLNFVMNFNAPDADFKSEPNIALLKLNENEKRIYISASRLVYIHDATTGDYLGEFAPPRVLEAMVADDYYQVLYIPDEGGQSGIYAFNPDGTRYERFGTNNFGNDRFQDDAEGISIYKCSSTDTTDTGCGFIIVADQLKSQTEFEFFDRETWRYLGQLRIAGVGNTDGIASLQKSFPEYPLGLFAAVNNDSSTVCVSWDTIFRATGLGCAYCGRKTLSFEPIDDAYVQSSKATKKFGRSNVLKVTDTEFVKCNSFLKFDIQGLTGEILSAKLFLHTVKGGEKAGEVHLVSNHYLDNIKPWDESNLAWTNAPPISGEPLDMVEEIAAADTTEFDITSALKADGIISLALKGASPEIIYGSKESAQPPKLLIEITDPAYEFGTFSDRIKQDNLVEDLIEAEELADIQLKANYPNPFNLETTIEYALPEAAMVRLFVFNVRGQLVRTLVDEFQTPGFKKILWDGKNQFGHEIGSGVYFMLLQIDEVKLTKKLTLQK